MTLFKPFQKEKTEKEKNKNKNKKISKRNSFCMIFLFKGKEKLFNLMTDR